jgi:hypothetical protein
MAWAWRGVRRRRDWLGGHARRGWPMASGGRLKAVVPSLWGCGAWRRCIGARTSVRGPGEPTIARVPRRAGPAEPRGDARRRGALWSARSQNSSNWHALTLFFSKKLNCVVDKHLNTKAADLLILYNFYKGHMAFFSTNCAQIASKVCCFLGACE